MKLFDDCNWAVCYDIPAELEDDRQEGRTVCGWFAYPFHAQDFIDKVLPPDNRNRFYVIHRDEIAQ